MLVVGNIREKRVNRHQLAHIQRPHLSGDEQEEVKTDFEVCFALLLTANTVKRLSCFSCGCSPKPSLFTKAVEEDRAVDCRYSSGQLCAYDGILSLLGSI